VTTPTVVALSGGVGGAKLASGLMRVLPHGTLRVIVNTGDDFMHLGLHISPDVDTTLYTLAGLANPETGWGRRDETWSFMEAMELLGGDTWFRLGDRDLALHVERTRRLAAGETPSQITADVAHRFGITADILPMTDDTVRTMVRTDEGELSFQDYFVRRRCRPRVASLRFDGAADARPAPRARDALRDRNLSAIVICPSNPYLSIDPILSVDGICDLLHESAAPVVAVSPLVGGRAVKGPTAKIMAELGLPVSAQEVARHYDGVLDGFVVDARPSAAACELDLPLLVTDTLMETLPDRDRLARETLEFAATLRKRRAA